MTATILAANYQMDADIEKGSIEDTSQIGMMGMDNHPKAIRNFTDLPAPFYSQRGSLISHENNSNFVRQPNDRTTTVTSLQSISSLSSDDEVLATYRDELIANESKLLNTNDAFEETTNTVTSPSHQVTDSAFSSDDVKVRSGSIDISRQSLDAKGIERRNLPTAVDNPSTPTDLSHFTKESVKEDDDKSDASSSTDSPMDSQKSKQVLKKRILMAMFVLFMYGLFSIVYQVYQSLYVAKDQLNDKPIPADQSISEINSYIASYLENRIGFWMQCTELGCRDLELYCSSEAIEKRLIDSEMIKANITSQQQKDDFIQNYLHICPMVRVSRFTSVFSVFAALLAMIGLFLAYNDGGSKIFTFIKFNGLIMVLLSLITLALAIAIKEILDHLVTLSQAYSASGSSTSVPYVDTFYYYSTSFWLCCMSFALSIIIFALFLRMSKSAKEIQEMEDDDRDRKDDLYSISTMESIDNGPRINTMTSDQSSTVRFNESIHNLTHTNSMDRIDSFEAPPVSDSKTVRFS